MNKSTTTGATVGNVPDTIDQIALLGRPMRFSELLENDPHNKATLYRFLQTLSSLETIITGPAYCTGTGKAIMAFLPAPQQQLIIQQQSFFAYTPNTVKSARELEAELDAIKATAIA